MLVSDKSVVRQKDDFSPTSSSHQILHIQLCVCSTEYVKKGNYFNVQLTSHTPFLILKETRILMNLKNQDIR